MTLVKFHQGQAAHQEQLAETLIHNASHIIIPEYITTVPDITSKIESSIEELMCETSLRPQKNKKLYHPHPPRRHLAHHQQPPPTIPHQLIQKTEFPPRGKTQPNTLGGH